MTSKNKATRLGDATSGPAGAKSAMGHTTTGNLSKAAVADRGSKTVMSNYESFG